MEATGQPGRESLGEGGGVKGLLGWPGHAQQAQCSRIATLPFFEADCACGVDFGLKVVLPARNRLIGGVGRLFWFNKAAGLIGRAVEIYREKYLS
jgi:hypothetical protein